MHPIQQHTDHPLEAVGQGRQTLDRPSNGAVDDEQHLIHSLTLLKLPLDLSQTDLICHPCLKEKIVETSFPEYKWCSKLADIKYFSHKMRRETDMNISSVS